MKENLVRLKSVLGERERVWGKVVQDYQHYKRNPPYTPDGNLVALETHVQGLFDTLNDMVGGYKDYIAALEAECGDKK
jgi:hypothetical protein